MFSRRLYVGAMVLCLMWLVPAAEAISTSGTVAVTATLVSSMSITFSTDASGITLSGSGTSNATIAFGSVQAFGGSVPVGVTRTTNGTTDWKLSTPFDITVVVGNMTSSNYTLTAQLASSDSTNTWQLNSTTVANASAATLTTTGTYGTTPYTLNLTIPMSENAGSISNTINFVATAN